MPSSQYKTPATRQDEHRHDDFLSESDSDTSSSSGESATHERPYKDAVNPSSISLPPSRQSSYRDSVATDSETDSDAEDVEKQPSRLSAASKDAEEFDLGSSDEEQLVGGGRKPRTNSKSKKSNAKRNWLMRSVGADGQTMYAQPTQQKSSSTGWIIGIVVIAVIAAIVAAGVVGYKQGWFESLGVGGGSDTSSSTTGLSVISASNTAKSTSAAASASSAAGEEESEELSTSSSSASGSASGSVSSSATTSAILSASEAKPSGSASASEGDEHASASGGTHDGEHEGGASKTEGGPQASATAGGEGEAVWEGESEGEGGEGEGEGETKHPKPTVEPGQEGANACEDMNDPACQNDVVKPATRMIKRAAVATITRAPRPTAWGRRAAIW